MIRQGHNVCGVQDPHVAIVQNVIARIQQARMDREISQEDLASMAGVSRGCVQHMEKGRTTPTLFSLLKICSALELDLPRTLSAALKKPTERATRK